MRFTVSDTGPGLSRDEARHVLEPCRRGSDPGYEGAGLGLALASGIVSAHGGRIGVPSDPGEGAASSFALPVARRQGREA